MGSKEKIEEKTELRKKAEEKLKKKYAYIKHKAQDDDARITEELWVHQIELEMQNEELRRTQLELEEARAKYSDLYNFAPAGYFVISKDGLVLEANYTSELLVGIPLKKIIGGLFSQFMTKESMDTFYLNRRLVFEKGQDARCEIKIQNKKKGSEFFADLIMTPVKDELGKVQSCRIGAVDITERKKIEDELSKHKEILEQRVKEKTTDLLELVKILRGEVDKRKKTELDLQKRTIEAEQSEKKYRTLVEVSPAAICVVKEGIIVLANESAAKIVNARGIDDLIGKSFLNFISPDSTKKIKGIIQSIDRGEKQLETTEAGMVRVDGSLTEIGGTAAVLDYDGARSVLIIFRDISQRKRQEAALRRLKNRLSEAQRIAHLGNWDYDITNNSLWLSDESYRIFGIDRETFDGKFPSLYKFIHPDEREQIKDALAKSISDCKPYNMEHRIIRPDGAVRYVHKQGEVQCENGKAIRMLGTIQDITEQKKAENQIILSRQKLRTLAAKMEMIEEQERRRIASDLHDSVGQILAFATRELKFLRKKMPAEYGDALIEVAEQLDKAVDQTRTLSFDLSPSILYDIGFEVAVEDLVEKFAKKRGIKCRLIIDDKTKPLTIPAKVLLYRSIRELLMNIAKHAEAKNVKVSLIRSDNNIQVTVEDDGKGFDMQEAESSEKSKGFGLFHIRERIEHSDGKFEMKSIKEQGTKITIKLPLSIEKF